MSNNSIPANADNKVVAGENAKEIFEGIVRETLTEVFNELTEKYMDHRVYVVIERWYERHYIDDGNDCTFYFNTFGEAKRYVDMKLEENLREMYKYYGISEDDEDAIKAFNEKLDTIYDDKRKVYGIYPYGGDDTWNEYKISEIFQLNM